MGLRTVTQDGVTTMYDSTIGQAFGPIIEDDDSENLAELFITWYDAVFRSDLRADWFSGATWMVMVRFGRWCRAVQDATTNEFNVSVAESLVKAARKDESDR